MTKDHDPECIFCKIAAGDIPTEFEYEDERVVAFHDINAQAPLHVLIIPRKHIPRVGDIPDDEGDLLQAINQAAAAIAKKRGVYDEGYRLVINSGDNGGQTVYHLHCHLLAGRFMRWPPG
ncbi:MAG: histidine triad nucleotide-binding protein [Candidatus Hinthialibacter antarcticus]|nr:histidine triad nucleotide-binding protein [Candidatus Hinthialibacter antarcticus]